MLKIKKQLMKKIILLNLVKNRVVVLMVLMVLMMMMKIHQMDPLEEILITLILVMD